MRKVVVAVLAVLFASNGAANSENLERLQSLNSPAYHEFKSETVGRPFDIFVRLPDGYEESNKRYPAIYLLDGGVTFPLLSSYYRYLRLGDEIPEMIIIGISYGNEEWGSGNFRSTDYTAKAEDRDDYGGAPAFQSMFEEELLPFIESRYRADPDRRIIFGQSLGGQFSLYTALTKPDLFWGHVASNPALHRNLPYFLEFDFEGEERNHSSRVFVSYGSLDEPRFRNRTIEWIAHWREKPKPWPMKTLELAGESHFSAVPAAFRNGVKWLFEDKPALED